MFNLDLKARVTLAERASQLMPFPGWTRLPVGEDRVNVVAPDEDEATVRARAEGAARILHLNLKDFFSVPAPWAGEGYSKFTITFARIEG